MSGFNLRKTTAQAKIHDKMLGDQQKETGTSMDSSMETIQSNLEGVRGEGQGENLDTTEGQMKEPHKAESEVDQLTQGQLEAAGGNHRDSAADDAIMKPIDAVAEARHQQYAGTYAADNKADSETKFWDEFVGEQLEREPHKVIASDPPASSQLSNHPDRFKDVTAEVSTEASIGDLDKEIFATFYGAASENRELTDSEAENIVSLSETKVDILNRIKNIAEER